MSGLWKVFLEDQLNFMIYIIVHLKALLVIEQFQEKSSVEEQKSDSVSGIVVLKTLKCSLEDYDMFDSTGPSLGNLGT